MINKNISGAPLVSIIIPFYKHNKFIEECVQSVVNDPYPNKEIIIIDDGSPPPLFDFENLIKSLPPVVIKFKRRANLGLTKTLNELVRMASGSFIVLLASDDFLLPNTLSYRVKKMINDNIYFLLSDAVVVDEGGNTLYSSSLFEMNNCSKSRYQRVTSLKKEIILNWSVAGAVIMLDRRVFDKVGWYDESLFIEDWDFYLRAAAQNLISFDDNVVSAYRLHSGSTCRNILHEKKIYSSLLKTSLKNIPLFSFPYSFMLLYMSFKLTIKNLLLYFKNE